MGLDQEENACTLTLGEQRFLVDFVRAVYNPEDIRDLNPQLYPEIKKCTIKWIVKPNMLLLD